MRKGIAGVLCLLLLGILAPQGMAGSAQRFTVVFMAQTLPAGAVALVEKAGGRVVGALPELGVLEVEGPARLMTALNRDPSVMAVTPSLEAHLNPAQVYEVDPVTPDPAYEDNPGDGALTRADLYEQNQWDIKLVTNAGASWSLGTGSHATVVGIIDSGINTQHKDLRENLLGGRNFVPGPDGTVDPANLEDENGHGSHVAGTIAGQGRIVGVGPNLGLRVYRVFGANGSAPYSRIARAMMAAADDDVDVISMSLSGFLVLSHGYWTAPDGTVQRFQEVADFLVLQRAVKYAVQRGTVVVAAAGNDATNVTNRAANTAFLNQEFGPMGFTFQGASRLVPGTLPGVITVSATGPDSSLALYSNFGPGSVDLTAPGGDYQRKPEMGWWTDMSFSAYKRNGSNLQGYAWMAGTSMAAPKVSAVAALLIDKAKTGGVTLTPSQVAVRLQQTAVPIGQPGDAVRFGRGMVNAYAALSAR